ncbi:MAG TPA: recombinase family protein [Reyranella sp.]|jgi:DNA invertase Pin-like site-specific DNA recombinase|nr:recombinase family protein [Chloroflexota bacterium]HZQ01355.1 recombinase family protein [Reyranella sp.]
MAKRVAVYVRVSTDAQTTTNQELELATVAQQAGWKIVKVYTDQGVSGGKRRDDRPAFKAMCEDAARRKFDIVAAWSVDRLSRSLDDLLSFVNELQALKIDLFLLSQGVDTSTPSGRAMFAMCGVFGELERGLIRERVLSGLNRARAQGKRLGRPRVSLEIEERIKHALASRDKGIKRIAKTIGVGTGTVQRIKAALPS